MAEKHDRIETSEDVVVAQGRPRALQQVLPRLHAQAVGARSVRARRQRDRARADPHQPRRPLLHRHLPGDAAARLHADVREDARPPEHQDHAQHRLSRDRRPGAVEAHGLHRADRRVLQLSARQAALPQPRVSPRQPGAGAVPAGRHGELSERLRLHARSASSSTSPARRSASTSIVYEYPRADGDPYYPVPRPENAALYKLYEADAEQLTNVTSSAGSRPTSTTTWTRSSARRWRRSSACRRRFSRAHAATPRRRRLSALARQARSSGGASRRPRPPRRR